MEEIAIENNKKTRRKKIKKILIITLSLIFIIITAMIINTNIAIKKYTYCSLQYMKLEQQDNNFIIEIKVENQTKIDINLKIEDFTTYVNDIPVRANDFITGIGTVTTTKGEVYHYDITKQQIKIESFKTNTIKIKFNTDYKNTNKPFKIYHRGTEITFDNPVKIKNYQYY